MNADSSLVLSKLAVPPPPARAVTRPRLVGRLNEGLDCKAVIVAAPAGYGKTTLVGDWVRQLELPVGWLSLDEKDNDLVRFWSYFAKAACGASGGLSDRLRAAASTLAPGLYEPYLVALLNELSGLKEPLVLVLDDWHAIDNAEIANSVAYLVEYLPSGVHICFASRTVPSFAKARWTSRGWVHELREEHLRFDLPETEAFFRLFADREPPREQLEHFFAKTEGWVTGLKLISLSMRDGDRAPRFPQGATGGKRVEQYLLEEVFESLDEPMRRFLLDVSILRRLNVSLCEAVSGQGGAEKLAELVRIGLFLIPLDEDEEWYRFHHLFGEFLRKRGRSAVPAGTDSLYRAAAWCESRKLLEEALDYYIDGGWYDDAVRLLREMRSVLIRREFSTLKAWLSGIPEPVLLREPYLYFSYIYALLWTQEPDQAERYLQFAERQYADASEGWSEEEKNRYLGYLYYVRNFKATQHEMDMMQGLEYIRLSLRYSPAGTDLIFASPQMPLTPSVFRSYNGKRGKHLPRGLADTFFGNMIEFMKQMGLQDSVMVCYGELLYERGELEEAERYLKLGLQGRSQAHYQPEKVYVPACLFLSRVSMARWDPEQAWQWLDTAAARAAEDGAEPAFILIDAEKAGIRLSLGDPSAAIEWQERYRLAPDDPVSVYQLFVYVFLVRTLMESGRRREAWALSERLFPIAAKGRRPMDALDIQVLQAMMLQREDKPEQALLMLEDALKHAEPDDYVRVFVDKGEPVAELLAAYVQQRQKGNIRDKNAPPLAFVRKVLSGFGGEAAAPRAPAATLEKLLTPREYAVFRQMEEGLDNAEIAEVLGIGMGTLKAHINHIYGKLQAANRVDALRRGKKLQQ